MIAKYSPLFPWTLSVICALFFSFSGSACQSGKETKRLVISTPIQTGLETNLDAQLPEKDQHSVSALPDLPPPQPVLFTKDDVKKLVDQNSFLNLQEKEFSFPLSDKTLHVETSLDISLQNYLLDRLEEVKLLKQGQPKYIGIVAIDPETGNVLAMTSFDKYDHLNNHCLLSDSPAASIFKIITASAAIEECGLTPASSLDYTGGKYTLYQSQLKNQKTKYSHSVTLKQSFAESINPIFGKIGVHTLKKDLLSEYAAAFCFNQDINFELPVSQSAFQASDNPFELAELASGYNRRTHISPLHGALLISVFLNQGKLIEPTIVEKITDEEGTLLYKSDVKLMNTALSKETSEAVKNMMTETIQSGTARKAFRGFQRDPILSKLFIGGKTGSMGNQDKNIRYDWFSGFAEEKNGTRKIAVAVVVAHEKFMGPRAGNYAKLTMKKFFNDDELSSTRQTVSKIPIIKNKSIL